MVTLGALALPGSVQEGKEGDIRSGPGPGTRKRPAHNHVV